MNEHLRQIDQITFQIQRLIHGDKISLNNIEEFMNLIADGMPKIREITNELRMIEEEQEERDFELDWMMKGDSAA